VGQGFLVNPCLVQGLGKIMDRHYLCVCLSRFMPVSDLNPCSSSTACSKQAQAFSCTRHLPCPYPKRQSFSCTRHLPCPHPKRQSFSCSRHLPCPYPKRQSFSCTRHLPCPHPKRQSFSCSRHLPCPNPKRQSFSCCSVTEALGQKDRTSSGG